MQFYSRCEFIFGLWKAAKETLAFGHVLETYFDVEFESCVFMTYLLKEKCDTKKTATHVDNMLTLVSVCGKRALSELWTLDVRFLVYQSIFGRTADRCVF